MGGGGRVGVGGGGDGTRFFKKESFDIYEEPKLFFSAPQWFKEDRVC